MGTTNPNKILELVKIYLDTLKKDVPIGNQKKYLPKSRKFPKHSHSCLNTFLKLFTTKTLDTTCTNA